jgi:ABC-type histidine transport system ATPase subunit
MDERNITSGNYLFRNTMFNKSFAANAGDVIKVVASCSRGRSEFIMSCIQAVIVY